jgi:hypothetical protein
VKVLGIIVAIPVVLFVVLMLTGGPGAHGPGRHLRSSGGAFDAPLGRFSERPIPSAADGGHTPSGTSR